MVECRSAYPRGSRHPGTLYSGGAATHAQSCIISCIPPRYVPSRETAKSINCFTSACSCMRLDFCMYIM